MKYKIKVIAGILLAEALLYWGLLVGIPALSNSLVLSEFCNAQELYLTSFWFYVPPGLIGVVFILLVILQKYGDDRS